MGNITELKRGSLNGLRRQTNECLVSAYYKGYADGKNEPNEEHEGYIRNLVNQAKQEGYDIGLEIGKKQAISEDKENEMYNKGLNDASDLLAFVDRRFLQECFPSESNWNIFDLNAKYGLAVVIKKFKKWQAEINQTKEEIEEEIKVGDIVVHKDDKIKGVVFRVEDGLVYGTNNYLNSFEWAKNLCTKVGHFDEVEQLLDKLKGDK